MPTTKQLIDIYDLPLPDLFKARDALRILKEYKLNDSVLTEAIEIQIEKRKYET